MKKNIFFFAGFIGLMIVVIVGSHLRHKYQLSAEIERLEKEIATIDEKNKNIFSEMIVREDEIVANCLNESLCKSLLAELYFEIENQLSYVSKSPDIGSGSEEEKNTIIRTHDYLLTDKSKKLVKEALGIAPNNIHASMVSCQLENNEKEFKYNFPLIQCYDLAIKKFKPEDVYKKYLWDLIEEVKAFWLKNDLKKYAISVYYQTVWFDVIPSEEEKSHIKEYLRRVEKRIEGIFDQRIDKALKDMKNYGFAEVKNVSSLSRNWAEKKVSSLNLDKQIDGIIQEAIENYDFTEAYNDKSYLSRNWAKKKVMNEAIILMEEIIKEFPEKEVLEKII